MATEKVCLDVDLEKFRWSLVGDGYIREEVANMTRDELIATLQSRVTAHITVEYDRTFRFGLLSEDI